MNQELAQDIQQLQDVQQLQQQQNVQTAQSLAQINEIVAQINLRLQNMYVLLNCGHDSHLTSSSLSGRTFSQ